MRTIIPNSTAVNPIRIEELSGSCFIGMEESQSGKYVLTCKFAQPVVQWSFRNVQARKGNWDSDMQLNPLLQRTARDERCKLYEFESLGELLAWANVEAPK